jgi:hypothetical protein
MEAMMGARTRQVKFAIPEELANSVEDLAMKCGVDPVDIVCVGLKIVTDIAREDEGLKYLQERAPQLKPGKAS